MCKRTVLYKKFFQKFRNSCKKIKIIVRWSRSRGKNSWSRSQKRTALKPWTSNQYYKLNFVNMLNIFDFRAIKYAEEILVFVIK